MKSLKSMFVCFTLIIVAVLINAQTFKLTDTEPKVEPYSNCAAIFFDDKMLVDEYSPNGKCELEEGMKGELSLYTVDLANGIGTPKRFLEFKVAIKNKQTNTVWMFSQENFTRIKLEDVLAKCTLGDNILIMTLDQEIALTHHEVEILWKC